MLRAFAARDADAAATPYFDIRRAAWLDAAADAMLPMLRAARCAHFRLISISRYFSRVFFATRLDWLFFIFS
jgi:hypothetical protein